MRQQQHHTVDSLPWYQDTIWARLVNKLSHGKRFPHPEQRVSFVLPEQYLPGYKSELFSQQQIRQHEPISLSTSLSIRGSSSDGNLEASEKGQPTSPENVSQNNASAQKDGTGTIKEANNLEAPPNDMNNEDDPYLVHWSGPGDPENPLNWSPKRKIFVTGLLCLLTFSVYLGSAIYTPGIVLIADYFGVGTVTATLGLTLFVVGYGTGPMLGLTAASEIPAIGRTLPYVVTLFFFFILQIPTALTSNIAGFMVLRFLTGLFGCPPLATGGASIGDMFEPTTRPFAMGAWGISAILGPVLGPVVGGFAAQHYGTQGFRWTIWPLLMLSGFTLIVLVVALPETSSSNILFRRCKRLRKKTNNMHLRTKGEMMIAHLTGKEIALMTFVRPFVLSFTEPIVLGINLHIGLVYGILYLWFECFPIVFVETYGFNLGEQGLAFSGIVVGAILAYSAFCLWVKYSYIPLYIENKGKVGPEKWLEPAVIAAWAIPICMFGFGWTANRSIHWIVPIIFSAFFAIGTFPLFQCGLAYLADCYPDYLASVFSGNDFFRSGIGAALPLVGHAMFSNLQKNGPVQFPVAWGCFLIGCISLVMAPIPLLLYRYGPRLRTWSSYALDPASK
ncbi:hypothetical protein EX895_001067 [Sporisorium graminicola]|uniref:Major facilitator superfamily (MFS) profile domain-containing protein n=1 Tax=Sporisorium graminicola TaxID=280036 RepID=A0A4U7KYX9_9BASI|nr:hypothetical protein EX895_001067 [Sporisorium graminicola]TKY89770.1 hypothetical protein EX895_001067 [Sporisorium graminicola]